MKFTANDLQDSLKHKQVIDKMIVVKHKTPVWVYPVSIYPLLLKKK